jgi:putative endonuclease
MQGQNQYHVYLMTSKSGTLYVGMTNNTEKMIYEHKNKLISGFAKKYNITRLVHFETFGDVRSAIGREKAIKGWLRKKKIQLVSENNPEWKDLSQNWYD